MIIDSNQLMQSAPGAYTTIGGREYLYFSGTGYLGLHGHAEIIRASCEATQLYGMGSATSRRSFGNTPPVLELEALVARFFGTDDAFYFMSGYLSNSVLIRAIEGTFDKVFIDDSSHYSVQDAAQLSGCPVYKFSHCSDESLKQLLKEQCKNGERPLVITDGVFPVQGILAPLREYYQVLSEYPGAAIIVDDAHALGVIGLKGRGSIEYLGLPWNTVNTNIQPDKGPRLFVGGTLSKAFGGFGGIVFGSFEFIAGIRNNSPYFRAANPLSPGVAAGCAQAIKIVMNNPEMICNVQENTKLVRAGLRKLGIETAESPVPIICVTLNTKEEMQRVQSRLMEQGIFIAYNSGYSDLGALGGLRIAIFATHTKEMIQRLLAGFAEVFKEL